VKLLKKSLILKSEDITSGLCSFINFTIFWNRAFKNILLCLLALFCGSVTPGRARANALAEIPLPWQSKVVIIKLNKKIF